MELSSLAIRGRASDDLERILASGLLTRARDRLGGSHTVVTYPPLDALDAVDGTETDAALTEAPPALSIYVHIAFCEYICKFCHYIKRQTGINEDGDYLDQYFKAVVSEFDFRSTLLSRAKDARVYFGGGTPLAVSIRRLDMLTQALFTRLGAAPASFCIEASPATLADPAGPAKLALLAERGLDRLSLGVQTFDPELMRAHRGHGIDVLERALQACSGWFDRLNIDLIQDLPGQTWSAIKTDLLAIERLRPAQVTWYIHRTSSGSTDHTLSRTDRLERPSVRLSATWRLQIINAMASIGYRSGPGGRFYRDGARADDYKAVRCAVDRSMLGFGASAYSHGWGWLFQNKYGDRAGGQIHDYIKHRNQGRSPVGQGMRLSEAEVRAGRRTTAIRLLLPHADVAGGTPDDIEARATLANLADCGAVRQDSEGWRLTQAGRVFEEEIASLFYSLDVKRRLAARGLYWGTGRS